MTPAEEFEPGQLVGKRVAFRDGEEHADCWHLRVGLARGLVKKVAQSLAQKAEMVGAEGQLPEGWFEDYEDVVRVWVKADPCESFKNGCEVAVERECLWILAPGEESEPRSL